MLKTGDLLLFSEEPTNCLMKTLDCCIKKCTKSRYSHAALVVVDPPWATHCKGTFVWESSYHGTRDPQDNEVKFGVQLTPIELYTKNYPGKVSIWVRTPRFDNVFTDEALMKIHPLVYKHGYDTRVRDWFCAAFCYKIQCQTEVFTCSAFVSFVLHELGVLDACWTVISAAELSSFDSTGMVEFKKKYSKDELLGYYPQPDSSLIGNSYVIL